MTIRKVGKDSNLKRRVTCKRCASILEYLPVDIKVSGGYCMGEYDTWSYIDCPECKAKVDIKS